MPSPQSIVYLFGFPTVVNVNVAVRGAPPAATSVAASTDFTNVLFLTFSNASFNLSIPSATLVVFVSDCTAPSVQLPSPFEEYHLSLIQTHQCSTDCTASNCAFVTICRYGISTTNSC